MVWNLFRRKRLKSPETDVRAANALGAESLPMQDTRAAIDELSQVVKNNPEAVEIYLALGSLYRSQGEIERAIQIRNSLIVRPGLDPKFKARAWFELGRDFRRGGFLDRAEDAFSKARELVGDNREIHLEMARLAAERSSFQDAADAYARLDQPLPRAHYLVRHAQECFRNGDEAHGTKALKQAVRAYPGSVEAWLETVVQAYRHGSASKVGSRLKQALEQVDPGIRFVLLEGLYQDVCKAEAMREREGSEGHDWASACSTKDVVEAVIPQLESLEPDVLLYYYGAELLLKNRDVDEAMRWFEKTLVLDPDFWLARLELFELSQAEQTLTKFFKQQLKFFMARAREVRRFYCGNCGLKRDTLFFICPRCRSWHSIKFRKDFSQ
ncbi:tetratricopeptide repeat protein [Salidesulfovibrio onnuriiensis]|uniref:tetratricopeptide repeat protein n=1 Tax=Salidesulfovibrio onnuriiensis TaxID=2583823 RepID=UPI00202B7DE2|nr:tetratricopeptide repeat protein [Salidesulfovibrio onnuriiensis]